MTKEEIKKIQIHDVLMNVHTHDVIFITEIHDKYFNCGWGNTMGYGSIPKKHLESPEWYSLMREREK